MPILSTNLVPDLRLAAALDQALLVMLTDMATIRNWSSAGRAAISNLGSINSSGSTTSQIRLAGLGGRDAFVDTAAEDTDVAETALTDGHVDIQVVRSALVRQISDLGTLTGFAQDINPESLANDMGMSFERYFNGLVGTAAATATQNVGSAAAMSVNDFYDAMAQLELDAVPGPYYLLLHNAQYSAFQASLRSEAGAVSFIAADSDMLNMVGPGLKGDFLGVSIFTSNDVTQAAGKKEGAMFGAGAFGYMSGAPDARSFLGAGDVVQTQDGLITVEIAREPGQALTKIVGNAYCGLSVIEQDRLCGVVTGF